MAMLRFVADGCCRGVGGGRVGRGGGGIGNRLH